MDKAWLKYYSRTVQKPSTLVYDEGTIIKFIVTTFYEYEINGVIKTKTKIKFI